VIVEGDYAADGFALVRGLLAPEICNAFLHRLKQDLDRPDAPLAGRMQSHGLLRRPAVEVYGFHYPPMLALLWGLTPIVSERVGRPLLPTYDYLRLYREGDVCLVHTDRPACEHSLSLTLDYSDGVPWPLEIGRDSIATPKPVAVEDFEGAAFTRFAMQRGDAVLYQGVHHRHGRITPNPNGWSAHLFLHWVDREGPYATHAFDGNADAARPVNLSLR
jgi:hypothetical protein